MNEEKRILETINHLKEVLADLDELIGESDPKTKYIYPVLSEAKKVLSEQVDKLKDLEGLFADLRITARKVQVDMLDY